MNRTNAASSAVSAAQLSRIVSAIPPRLPRSMSGTVFSLDGPLGCSAPARLACVVRLLQWLAPLQPLSADDQRALGINGTPGRLLAVGEEPPEAEPDELSPDSGHDDCTSDLVH